MLPLGQSVLDWISKFWYISYFVISLNSYLALGSLIKIQPSTTYLQYFIRWFIIFHIFWLCYIPKYHKNGKDKLIFKCGSIIRKIRFQKRFTCFRLVSTIIATDCNDDYIPQSASIACCIIHYTRWLQFVSRSAAPIKMNIERMHRECAAAPSPVSAKGYLLYMESGIVAINDWIFRFFHIEWKTVLGKFFL